MKLDPTKLVKHRQHLGYSQRDVADKSNVSERTVQRAEAGISVSNENAAAIAAALQTKLQPLLLESKRSEESPAYGKTMTLRRALSGRAILDTLDQTAMGVIECDVEATGDNLALLKNIAHLLETNMNDPLDADKLSWPPRRPLADRLELIANLNAALNELENDAISVYMAETWVDAFFPRYDYYDGGGFYFPEGNEAVGCRAVRFVISTENSEKLTRRAFIKWPISVVADLDDDFPF